MKQIITLKALIKKDQKVLLVRRPNADHFELPGGVLTGENPREELSSILKKDLGHAAQVMQLQDAITKRHQDDTREVCLLFLVALEGQSEKIKLGSAYDRYVWEGLSKLQPNMLDSIARNALQLGDEIAKTEVKINTGSPYGVGTTTISKEVIVYTDGGSRGNPGPSAAGFVILGPNEELLFEGGKYLGITTNNQAEYQAVKLGLEKALELGARRVKFRMDSLLIVNQMSGIYQIKNRDLWPVYASIKQLVHKFEHVSFSHVRREFNREADALVNKVLDEQAG